MAKIDAPLITLVPPRYSDLIPYLEALEESIRAKLEQEFMRSYGAMILSVSGAPGTMNGVDTNYTLVNIFDTVTAQSSDISADGVDVDVATNYSLTFNTPGFHFVHFWASFSASTGGALVTFRPHVNGNAGPIEVDRDVAAGDTGVVAFSGIINYAEGDVVDIRVKVDAGTNNLTFLAAGFMGFRMGLNS